MNLYQLDIIEGLLVKANLSYEAMESTHNALYSFSEYRANTAIEWLKDNQLCPIQSGYAYSQTDILNKLRIEI